MRNLFLIMLLFFLGCKNQYRKFSTIQFGDLIAKGYMISDSAFDDTVRFYDHSNHLIKTEYFRDGVKKGISVIYYTTGKVKQIFYYSDDLKNGTEFYYDSLQDYYYQDFYYYGISVGPIIYVRNQQPSRFYFINLQNETLLDIDYNNWQGINSVYKKCINFTSNISRVDSTRFIDMLLYLIKPPKFSFAYSIVKKKISESQNDFSKVFDIDSKLPFLTLNLPLLRRDEEYAVKVNVFDSLLNKESVIYKDVSY